MTTVQNAAASALLAQSRAFDRVADNVANIRTRGYVADRPVLRTKSGGGVELVPEESRRSRNADQPSDVDLATEVVDIISISSAYKAAVELVKTDDEMQKELLKTVK